MIRIWHDRFQSISYFLSIGYYELNTNYHIKTSGYMNIKPADKWRTVSSQIMEQSHDDPSVRDATL